MDSGNTLPHEFITQVVEVKSKRTASNDIEYRVTLVTDDPKIIALGLIDAHTAIKIKVELMD